MYYDDYGMPHFDDEPSPTGLYTPTPEEAKDDLANLMSEGPAIPFEDLLSDYDRQVLVFIETRFGAAPRL